MSDGRNEWGPLGPGRRMGGESDLAHLDARNLENSLEGVTPGAEREPFAYGPDYRSAQARTTRR